MSHNAGTPDYLTTFRFSVAPANTTGNTNAFFTSKDVSLTDLQQTFQSQNYSAITWKNGQRKQEHFESASGMILDLDKDPDQTIEKTIARLQELNLSYALITSKSHSAQQHRYHFFIPFSRPIRTLEQYHAVVRTFYHTYFPSSDSTATEGARFFFHSPDGARYESDFTRPFFDVDASAEVQNDDTAPPDVADSTTKRVRDAWDDGLKVTTSDGETIQAISVRQKTPILCPFHADSASSAFLGYSETSFNHYIVCSSCRKTFWHTTDASVLDRRLDRFWSQGDTVYEAGFHGSAFSFEKIGKEKFGIRAGATTKEETERLYAHMSLHKHLHNLGTVEYHGTVQRSEPRFEVQQTKGLTIVELPAIASEIEDNAFVEGYLQRTFALHTGFIKQYLAAYCYTNFRKLPTLILTGKRGTGKNTFAELLGAIYPELSTTVQDLSGQFMPFLEKKLAIVDEALRQGRLQYADLKKLSGQEHFEVNKKYKSEYQVRNNLNLVILSNEHIPITVAAHEVPSDSRNNQFFVFEMQPFTGSIDPGLATKLRQRLGHYIRSELRRVFDTLPATGYRYTIDVPITDAEKELFENNTDEIALELESIVDEIANCVSGVCDDESAVKYRKNFEKGLIPVEYLEERLKFRKIRRVDVMSRMKQAKLCQPGNPERKIVDGKKRTCLVMTPELYLEIKPKTPVMMEPTDPRQIIIAMETHA